MESRLFDTEFENITREWEAKQNDKGIIYYVNTKQTTSWNHPYFNKILEDLGMYRNIKYAAYRTSLKLRYLQSHIGLNWIKLAVVKETFADHTDLTASQLSHSEALPLIQNVLHISDEHQTEEDIRTAADLILNLMMNLYDVHRCGKISLRSLRNALITMCSSRLTEKYQCFFTSVSDEDQNVSKEKLFFLLDDLIQIPYALKEGASFGRNVAGTVESCFKAGSLGGKVNVECFYRWLMQEPQTLVWLPAFHRVLATETVEHNVSCNACGSVRITGLRYRCLQCVKYELCQSCFLQGQTSLSHKLKHPVREYCLPTSIKDNTKALLDILKNKLRRHHRRQTKTAYLPVKPLTEDGALTNWQPDSIHNSIASVSDSVDSGLALGTEHQEADIEEAEVKKFNKTTAILGGPCSASSPFMRVSDQELVMARRGSEIQQQQMEQQIEQLRRENRMLQSKLNLIYRYCDAELTNELSAIDKYGAGTSFNSLSKDLVKETLDISVSPIVNNSITSSKSLVKRQASAEDEHSSSVHEQSVDIRHIIGILTPIRHTQLTSNTSQLVLHQNELSAESRTFAGQNDSSVPDGLGYWSADMSLTLDSTEGNRSQEKPDICQIRAGFVEAVTPRGLVDALGDVTLGYSTKPDGDVTEGERRALLSQKKGEFTRGSLGQILENSSLDPSKSIARNIINTKIQLRKTSEKKQPYLFYSSRDLKSKPSVSCSAADQSDLSYNSESLHSNINDDENPLTDKSRTRVNDDTSEMLDEISDYTQAHTHSRNPSLSPTMTTLKQRMMGQVLMSTPVSTSDHVTSWNFLRKQFRTMSLPWTSDEDKENNTDTLVRQRSKHSQSISSIDMSHMSAASSHRSPVRQKSKHSQSISNIDMSHLSATSSHGALVRQKSKHSPSEISIGVSHLSASPSLEQETQTLVHSLLSSQNLNSVDITEDGSGTGNLSSLFRKAEHIWDIVKENMPETGMSKRDVLEKKMMDFKKECTTDKSLCDGLFDSPRTTDNGSILTAVGNVGNAMANFVHTTEQCQ